MATHEHERVSAYEYPLASIHQFECAFAYTHLYLRDNTGHYQIPNSVNIDKIYKNGCVSIYGNEVDI